MLELDKTTTFNPLPQHEAEQKIEQQLINLLKQGDEAQRCYSAQTITSSQLSTAHQALADNLYHPDPDVVIDSASALGKIEHSHIEQLEEVARHHPDGDARLAALTALSDRISNPRVATLFRELALGRQEDDWGLSSDWDEWWDIQLKAVEVLVTTSDINNLPLLLTILEQDPEPELTSLIYNGIARIDVNWIVDKLPQVGLVTKRKLVKSLAHNDSQMARAFLFKQLKSDDSELKKIAIENLANKNAKEYLWDIIQCLTDPHPSVQKQALTAIEALNCSSSLDYQRLVQLAKQAPETAKPAIIQLLLPLAELLPANDLQWLIDLCAGEHHESAVAAMTLLSKLNLEVQDQLDVIEVLINRAKKRTTPLLTRCDAIRLLPRFPLHHQVSLSMLQSIVESYDQADRKLEQDPSLRQASLEVIAHTKHQSFQQIFRRLLLGKQAFSNQIEVTQLNPPQDNAQPRNALEEHTDEVNSQDDLANILANYDTDAITQPNSDHIILDSEPNELEITEAQIQTSTLGAISKANIEAMLQDGTQPQQDDPSTSIMEMVEGMDEHLQSYGDMVKANFESADNLNLNRKKIARLPQASNKTLAIRALGKGDEENNADLLIEGLLGASHHEIREIFQALTQLKARHPKLKSPNNGIGAAGNAMHYGDDLTKQAAAHFLAHMPVNKAVPMLTLGATDPNEHVRYCCLSALETLLNKGIRSAEKIHIIRECALTSLLDTAGGVRRQALLLLTKINLNSYNENDINTLIKLAIDDDECNVLASQVLKPFRSQILSYLAPKLSNLSEHNQPFALRLIGAVL